MRKSGGEEAASYKEEITVVIPFKNELQHLPGIIGDLKAQDYPPHLFTVIMVNDHSNDGSEALVKELMEDGSGFSCLDLPPGRKGKKEAIAHALANVTAPWVLQTDADCRVGPRFISSHMHFLRQHPSDLVAGFYTTAEKHGGLLEAFERLDLLALNGSGAGSFTLGVPIMCSGANLLYSTSLYHETRKFDPVEKTGSGDDMFLMIGARKLKRNLAFNPGIDCLVKTSPAEQLSALIRQRIRWGAKSVHYDMPGIQLVAVLVAATNMMMLMAPLWMVIRPESCSWLLPGIGMKLLADYLVLAATAVKIRQLSSLWWYLPVSLLYPVYLAIVIAGAIRGRSVWK